MRAALRQAVAASPVFWALLSGFLCLACPLAGIATGVAGIGLWMVPWAAREWRDWREARR